MDARLVAGIWLIVSTFLVSIMFIIFSVFDALNTESSELLILSNEMRTEVLTPDHWTDSVPEGLTQEETLEFINNRERLRLQELAKNPNFVELDNSTLVEQETESGNNTSVIINNSGDNAEINIDLSTGSASDGLRALVALDRLPESTQEIVKTVVSRGSEKATEITTEESLVVIPFLESFDYEVEVIPSDRKDYVTIRTVG